LPQLRSEGGEPSAPATPGLIPLSYTTGWDAAERYEPLIDEPVERMNWKPLGAEQLEEQ
jgi:hypothetical protein